MLLARNIGHALLITLLFLGPSIAALWFSWRGVVAAALVLAGLTIGAFTFFGVLLGAGSGSMGQALMVLVGGMGLAVALGLGALFLIRRDFPIKVGATLIAAATLLWAYFGFQDVTYAWKVVGR